MTTPHNDMIRHILAADPAAARSLTPQGLDRRDAILQDLVTRAPRIHRARIARRAGAIAAPILALGSALALVLALATKSPILHRAPITHNTSDPITAPADTDTHAPALAASNTDVPSLGASQMNPLPSNTLKVRIVSTAGIDYSTMIARNLSPGHRSITRIIGDGELMETMASLGTPEGLVRIEGRTLLASDFPPIRPLHEPDQPTPPRSSL